MSNAGGAWRGAGDCATRAQGQPYKGPSQEVPLESLSLLGTLYLEGSVRRLNIIGAVTRQMPHGLQEQ